jgi:hypothetical protein
MPNINEFVEKLKLLVTDNPHILQVFLLADGSYTLNAYEFKGELYSRIDPTVNVPNAKNVEAIQAKYKIVQTITREDILKTAEALEHPEPVKTEEVKLPEVPPEPVKTGEPAPAEEAKASPAPEPAPEQEVHPDPTPETTQN